MTRTAIHPSRMGLDSIGLATTGTAYWNLRPPQLVTESVRRYESELAANGALVAQTGERTGRSPKDKFFVREAESEKEIDWGPVNVPIARERYLNLRKKMFAHLGTRDFFVQDLYAGASPEHRLNVRVITEFGWHSLFARQLFIRPDGAATETHKPDFTVVAAPNCLADPEIDGTNSNVFVIVSFADRLVLIGGTRYAGEIKKSIFTIMNYLLPLKGVFSMHCSANEGAAGDTALYFGLSGTGKTTLSADPGRRLIGDDEHGWSDDGIFNIEGGCYAKVINLSAEYEPQIFNAIRFGAVLENVVLDRDTRAPRYDDSSVTENTRVAYPLDYIDNAREPAVGGHPRNVVFLTCDAFGVLPPVSRLSEPQAMYHFLSGYTAKVAGTEAGVTEPSATFSTCFGAPFMALNPARYAELLGDRIRRHNSAVWLVNTGWTGGPYGVGKRMSLPYTRSIISAILDGSLDAVPATPHPVFGVAVPASCPGVPPAVLDPRGTWSDPRAYDAKAAELARRFATNFERFSAASEEIRAAGPRG